MPKYQVQLKQGKNVKVVNVEGKSVPHVLAFFEFVSTMKVTEIRHVVYSAPEDTVIPVDDFNYFSYFKAFVKNDDLRISHDYLLNNIKKTRSEKEIFAKMIECFEIDNLPIQSIYSPLFKE
jgi:hypothetical protein